MARDSIKTTFDVDVFFEAGKIDSSKFTQAILKEFAKIRLPDATIDPDLIIDDDDVKRLTSHLKKVQAIVNNFSKEVPKSLQDFGKEFRAAFPGEKFSREYQKIFSSVRRTSDIEIGNIKKNIDEVVKQTDKLALRSKTDQEAGIPALVKSLRTRQRTIDKFNKEEIAAMQEHLGAVKIQIDALAKLQRMAAATRTVPYKSVDPISGESIVETKQVPGVDLPVIQAQIKRAQDYYKELSNLTNLAARSNKQLDAEAKKATQITRARDSKSVALAMTESARLKELALAEGKLVTAKNASLVTENARLAASEKFFKAEQARLKAVKDRLLETKGAEGDPKFITRQTQAMDELAKATTAVERNLTAVQARQAELRQKKTEDDRAAREAQRQADLARKRALADAEALQRARDPKNLALAAAESERLKRLALDHGVIAREKNAALIQDKEALALSRRFHEAELRRLRLLKDRLVVTRDLRGDSASTARETKAMEELNKATTAVEGSLKAVREQQAAIAKSESDAKTAAREARSKAEADRRRAESDAKRIERAGRLGAAGIGSASEILAIQREAAKAKKIIADAGGIQATNDEKALAAAKRLADLKVRFYTAERAAQIRRRVEKGESEIDIARSQAIQNLNERIRRNAEVSAQATIRQRELKQALKEVVEVAAPLAKVDLVGPFVQQFGSISKAARQVSKDDLPQFIEGLKQVTKEQKEQLKATNLSASQRSQLSASLYENGKALQHARERFNGFNSVLEQSARLFRQFFRYALGYGALYQVLTAVRSLVKEVVDLQQAMKSIQAISASTEEEMRKFGNTLTRVALETRFTLTEVAKAATVIAQAGVAPKDFDSVLEAVSRFASATDTAIDLAADLQTTIRNVFTDLDDRTIANLLTKALNISKLTATDLKTILSLGLQVSKSYGLTAEQFLAAVTTLRNAGLKASTVATGTREAILEIFSPDNKTLKAWVQRYREIGEDMSEAAIRAMLFRFRTGQQPLVDALTELRRLGFNTTGRLTFGRAFDRRAENAIQALIANYEELGSTASTITFGDAAFIAASTQMEGLQASLKNTGVALVAFTEQITSSGIQSIERYVDKITDLIASLSKLDQELVRDKRATLLERIGGAAAGATLGFVSGPGGVGSRLARAGAGGVAGYQASVEAGEVQGAKARGEDVSAFQEALPWLIGVVSAIALFWRTKTGPTIAAVAVGHGLGKLLNYFNGVSDAIKQVVGVAGVGAKLTGSISSVGRLLFRLLGGWVGVFLTVASVAAFAYKKLGGETQTKAELQQAADEAIKSSQALTQKAKSDLDAMTSYFRQFELPGAGESAEEGTIAKSVDEFITNVETLDKDINRFFSKTFSPEEMIRVKEFLERINKEAPEAASPARNALLQEFAKTFNINLQAMGRNVDQTISDLSSRVVQYQAVVASGVSNFTRQINQIMTQAPTESGKVFLDEVRKAMEDDRIYGILTGAIQATPEEWSTVMADLMNNIYQSGLQVTKEKADKLAQETTREVKARVEALVVGGPEEVREGLFKSLSGLDFTIQENFNLLQSYNKEVSAWLENANKKVASAELEVKKAEARVNAADRADRLPLVKKLQDKRGLAIEARNEQSALQSAQADLGLLSDVALIRAEQLNNQLAQQTKAFIDANQEFIESDLFNRQLGEGVNVSQEIKDMLAYIKDSGREGFDINTLLMPDPETEGRLVKVRDELQKTFDLIRKIEAQTQQERDRVSDELKARRTNVVVNTRDALIKKQEEERDTVKSLRSQIKEYTKDLQNVEKEYRKLTDAIKAAKDQLRADVAEERRDENTKAEIDRLTRDDSNFGRRRSSLLREIERNRSDEDVAAAREELEKLDAEIASQISLVEQRHQKEMESTREYEDQEEITTRLHAAWDGITNMTADKESLRSFQENLEEVLKLSESLGDTRKRSSILDRVTYMSELGEQAYKDALNLEVENGLPAQLREAEAAAKGTEQALKAVKEYLAQITSGKLDPLFDEAALLALGQGIIDVEPIKVARDIVAETEKAIAEMSGKQYPIYVVTDQLSAAAAEAAHLQSILSGLSGPLPEGFAEARAANLRAQGGNAEEGEPIAAATRAEPSVFEELTRTSPSADEPTLPVAPAAPAAPTLVMMKDASGNWVAYDEKLRKMDEGGSVPGFGGGDTHPALLEGGEHVMRKEVRATYGSDFLSRLNALKVSPRVLRMSEGGPVGTSATLGFDTSSAQASLSGLLQSLQGSVQPVQVPIKFTGAAQAAESAIRDMVNREFLKRR